MQEGKKRAKRVLLWWAGWVVVAICLFILYLTTFGNLQYLADSMGTTYLNGKILFLVLGGGLAVFLVWVRMTGRLKV